MANQQAYQAYPQSKGTLLPGQTISVNNYTVQVERYLSQGGFAHVYLVRTPAPVYNTTHHVLKRIAVASEVMLTEVKKEVDIMRLLKGHPNIVHFIDAAWHKLPNGTFEVFILMEYCPGGGIIDMMNRRLRERLTEAEILQIFVDVCEGVAYMHSSRPPLLHRDLKVENILQSSSTSFKLCDFGSAATVQNPPNSTQEVRALEADLNKHTTLQYRAPEMVDVYSKRPINEKSDVWALGVLLYKLCYYTTPFEEHGPLAIINVQYHIPPYPVYSQDMNMLIGSMLREHGSQRPTVFELLNHVHRLRGTKSKFSYNIPVPPPLFPRGQSAAAKSPVSNPLEGLVTYATPPTKLTVSHYEPRLPPNLPITNQGIQARDKVLDAIAPMRRGRPTASHVSSRPSSPQKNSHDRQTNKENVTNWSSDDFANEQDKAWQAVAGKNTTQKDASSTNDGWVVVDSEKKFGAEKSKQLAGFGDDFAERLWTSADPNSTVQPPPRLSPRADINTNVLKPTDLPITSLAFTGTSKLRVKPDRLTQNKNKDAFEGLGLMTSVPKTAPTLGEARKLRTGLAVMSVSSTHENFYRNAGKSNSNSDRPTPSPQPKYLSLSPVQPQAISPLPTPGSSNSAYFRPSPSPSKASPSPATTTADGPTIESRFPSLEELDARFTPSSSQPVNALYPSAVNDASPRYTPHARLTDRRSQYFSSTTGVSVSGTGGNLLKLSNPTNTSHLVDGVRSEHVTGSAMRDPKERRKPDESVDGTVYSRADSNRVIRKESPLISLQEGNSSTRPLGVKKQPSSVSIEHALGGGEVANAVDNQATQGIPSSSVTPKLPPRPPASPVAFSSNDSLIPPGLPPRPSTSQASTPPRDWLTGEDPEESKVTKLHTPSDVPILRESPSKRASFIESSNFIIPSSVTAQPSYPSERLVDDLSLDASPTVAKFKRSFPAIDRIDTQKSNLVSSSGLTDNWSPVATKREFDVDSSSEDEGPEEPKGAAVSSVVAQKRLASRAKGRQSSVHELVHQYGGGVAAKEKEKERDPYAQPGPYSIGDYKPEKVKPTKLVPPTASDSSRKTPSPIGNTTKTTSVPVSRSRPQPQVNKDRERPLPPPIATKPSTSARSRPQSMFIFPSKSADSSTSPTTTNLLPPPESKPRAVRRTSISDMVQRYEAIGGSAKSPNVVSPVTPLPISTRATAVSTENGLTQKPFLERIAHIPSTSIDTSARSNVDSKDSRTTVFEPVRQTTTGLSRTPTKVHRKFTTDKDRPPPGSSPSPDKTALKQRRLSVKAEPHPTSSHRRSESTARSTKLSISETSRPGNSPRKPPISLNDEEPAARPEERPPSPERPYQGVGRLIDQWQKKSAEASQPLPVPPGKRKDILPKRAGIVQGDDR